MKTIIELDENEAREFLLKANSYSSLTIPIYYNFEAIINKLSKEISGKKLSDFRKNSPRDYDDVNHFLISNKDGKYAWRPFQLIHPAIYVSLVHEITTKENWKLIKKRFRKFQENNRIECHSLPVISESAKTTDQTAQILTWWQMIEQRSMTLALDYKYVLHTDITDCYGSIYTHSLSWALHTKEIAKKKENRNKKSFIGVTIDNHLQDMSYGQTNGIPQGSAVMDFIAEIVLGYVDLLLSKKIDSIGVVDYRILRYRDDYRIFTKNSIDAERITKELSEILIDLGMKLNADKTIASNDIIKSSIKADKRYWIENKRKADNKQKWLIQLYLLSERFPNSGTVDTQMRDFLNVLKRSKKKDHNLETLISLVTEISLRNPRVVPIAIAILTIFIDRIKGKDKKIEIINKIKLKYNQIPNSSFIMVWFQRLYLTINKNGSYNEALCKLVYDKNEVIWNSDWLNEKLKNIFKKTELVDYQYLKKMKSKITRKELKEIMKRQKYSE